MKYIKWIEVTLKLGIYYIVQKMMVNNEEIRFHQKGRVKGRSRRTSESSACPYMPRRELSEWRYYLESDLSMRLTLGLEHCYLLILKRNDGKFKDRESLGWDASYVGGGGCNTRNRDQKWETDKNHYNVTSLFWDREYQEIASRECVW